MKKHMTTGSIFLFLLLLCSCGQKVTPSKLVVSTGFITQTPFTGGLVVSAYGPAGEVKTETVSNSNTITFSLTHGTWQFYVVGWDGGSTFGGMSKCGVTSVTLSDKATDVPISITTAGCNNAAFKTNSSSVAGGEGFFPLQIKSCSHLYESIPTGLGTDPTPISSTTSDSILNYSFCDGATNPDIVTKAKSYRVKIPGSQGALASGCINTAGSTPLNLPTDKIPMIIELFGEQNCLEGENYIQFHFKKGIASGAVTQNQTEFLTSFFKPYFNSSSSNLLLLPFSGSWSAYSPLITHLPKFTCSNASCTPMPSLSGATVDYIVSNNSQIILSNDPAVSCSQITTTSSTANLTIQGCYQNENLKYAMASANSYCNTTTPCNFEIAIQGQGTFNKTVAYVENVQSILSDVYQTIGIQNAPAYIQNSIWGFYDGPSHPGVLRDVRENLSTNGPVGILGNMRCSEMNGEKIASRMDEGQLKVFQLIAKDDNLTDIPTSICDGNTPNPSICPAGYQKFEKVLTFRELQNGSFTTRQVVRVHCSAKIGVIEEYHNDSHDRFREERSLTFWNTENELNSRFLALRSDKEYTTATKDVLKYHRTSSRTAQKSESNAGFMIFIQEWEKHLTPDGLGYSERAEKKEYFLNNGTDKILSNSLQLSIPSTPSLYSNSKIFNSLAADKTKKISNLNFLHQDINSSGNTNGVFDYAEEGYIKALAYVRPDQKIGLKIFDGSNWISRFIDTTVSVAPNLHLRDGKLLVTWFTAAPSYYLKSVIYNISGDSFTAPLTLTSAAYPAVDFKGVLTGNGDSAFYAWQIETDPNLKTFLSSEIWSVIMGTILTRSQSVHSQTLQLIPKSNTHVIAIFREGNELKQLSYDISSNLWGSATSIMSLEPTEFYQVHRYNSGSEFQLEIASNAGTSVMMSWNGSSLSTLGSGIQLQRSLVFGKCLSLTTLTTTACGEPFQYNYKSESQIPRSLERLKPQVFESVFTDPTTFKAYVPN